jgi:TfoX/Sxy family transcriptional regulator of competence genes
MATDRTFVQHVCDQLGPLGATARPMFGEFGLYISGKLVALVCDNDVFVKPTDGVVRLAGDVPRRPPYPGAREQLVVTALVDDRRELAQVMRAAHEAAVAAPTRSGRRTNRG